MFFSILFWRFDLIPTGEAAGPIQPVLPETILSGNVLEHMIPGYRSYHATVFPYIF